MTNFRKQFLPQFEMDTIQLCNMFHALKNRVFNFNRPEIDNQRFVIVLHLKVDYFDLDRKKVDLFDRDNSEICKDLVAECSFVFCERRALRALISSSDYTHWQSIASQVVSLRNALWRY